jgi:tetraacyldisaccharide 4'-kinase
LREPASRDRDATLITGISKTASKLKSGILDEYFLGRRAFSLGTYLGTPYQLINSAKTLPLESIGQQYLPKNITAIAGLGNPARFFDDLAKHGVNAKQIPLPDHANYTAEFFGEIKAQCILITEKDAVKCSGINDDRIWVVPMSLHLPDTLMEWLVSILQRPNPYRYTL